LVGRRIVESYVDETIRILLLLPVSILRNMVLPVSEAYRSSAVSTLKIEELLRELKKDRTIIIVTHNMEQARRISDNTAFFYNGTVVESGETLKLFSGPETELLDKYIRGRF
jgi:phosphate transport system ATP-binding protein